MMGCTKGLALLLMLVIIVAHLSPGEAGWWGRRRRRSCHVPRKPAGKHWANDWDKQMHFECPYAKSISSLYSIYSPCHKDRVWAFGCRGNPAATVCRWTYNANGYDKMLNFHCHGFISGIRSHHHNHHEDRQFSFKCCQNHRFVKHGCITTPYWQNGWRGTLNYHVPNGYYLAGATSVHDNGQEDRRWQFQYCKLKLRLRGRDEANEAEKEEDPDTQDNNTGDMNPDEDIKPENVADAENTVEENEANAENTAEEPDVANAENTAEENEANAENTAEENEANAENTAEEPDVANAEKENTEENAVNAEE